MPDCPCSSPAPQPHRLLSRRHVLIGGAAATGALALSSLPAGAQTPGSATELQPGGGPRAIHPDDAVGTSRGWNDVHGRGEKYVRPIMYPIAGPNTTLDNYRIPQRPTHQGVDVMANKMVKLLSCVDGVVAEFRHRATPSGSSMNSLYIRGDDGWYYCYLHINNDRPGTDDGSNLPQNAWSPALAQYVGRESAARGHRLRKGELIAYVGDSGNAENAGSHLHFEIRKPTASLWDAAAVNPQYSLNEAEPARVGASVPPETFTPWTTSEAFITRQYQDLLGRAPDAAGLVYWTGVLDSGHTAPQVMMANLLIGAECDGQVHAVTRLYQAYFLRRPDQAGFTYWVGRRRGGASLAAISDFFAASSEFTNRYGSLSDDAFVDRIYRNVLGRAPDASGMEYWTSKLASGSTRGWVMVQFSESAEYRAQTQRAVHIAGSFGCMLRRMPTAGDIATWSPHSNANTLNMLRLGDEYARVVGA